MHLQHFLTFKYERTFQHETREIKNNAEETEIFFVSKGRDGIVYKVAFRWLVFHFLFSQAPCRFQKFTSVLLLSLEIIFSSISKYLSQYFFLLSIFSLLPLYPHIPYHRTSTIELLNGKLSTSVAVIWRDLET